MKQPLAAIASVERVTRGMEELLKMAESDALRFGVNRLAFTSQDMAARRWFLGEVKAAGLNAEIDPFGNVFGWTDFPAPGVSVVATGSHLDTVPGGGNYDGALGALCALEAVRTIRDSGLPRTRPLVVIAFAAEESVRFGRGCLGSAAMVGAIDANELLALIDNEGISVKEALQVAGLTAENLASVRRPPGWACGFLEVHIDQGPYLQDVGVPLGIVTAISGPVRHWITFEGQTMHSGAAPMSARRDALAGAAELIVRIESLGRDFSPQHIVTTVGRVDIEPGFMTAVPGRTRVAVDVRGPDHEHTWAVWDAIWAEAQEIGRRRRLEVSKKLIFELQPVSTSPSMVDLLANVSRELGVPVERMLSGSGHDAMNLARQMDIGMLFVRNKSGVSHSPLEYCAPEDIGAALQVLTGCLRRLACSA